jgi:hypothetical protein
VNQECVRQRLIPFDMNKIKIGFSSEYIFKKEKAYEKIESDHVDYNFSYEYRLYPGPGKSK